MALSAPCATAFRKGPYNCSPNLEPASIAQVHPLAAQARLHLGRLLVLALFLHLAELDEAQTRILHLVVGLLHILILDTGSRRRTASSRTKSRGTTTVASPPPLRRCHQGCATAIAGCTLPARTGRGLRRSRLCGKIKSIESIHNTQRAQVQATDRVARCTQHENPMICEKWLRRSHSTNTL
jgi:hypothetical protein